MTLRPRHFSRRWHFDMEICVFIGANFNMSSLLKFRTIEFLFHVHYQVTPLSSLIHLRSMSKDMFAQNKKMQNQVYVLALACLRIFAPEKLETIIDQNHRCWSEHLGHAPGCCALRGIHPKHPSWFEPEMYFWAHTKLSGISGNDNDSVTLVLVIGDISDFQNRFSVMYRRAKRCAPQNDSKRVSQVEDVT